MCGLASADDSQADTRSLPAQNGQLEVTQPAAPTTSTALDGPPGYAIVRPLGEGGMGVVYLARQVGFNRLVALKMIRAGDQAGPHERARFQTEAESIARLSHAHIVQVFEVGAHDGQPFFSMEFCGGGSLRDRLREHPLAPADAARIVAQLADAMAVAHGAGVLHRDLKPANVLLTEGGAPKLADFGLAKRLDDTGQTVPGTVLGTPSYMAPEQARGDAALTAGVDIYALGAILYECLTGRPPFKAATVWETVAQVLRAEVVSPRQLNAKVPRDLETICLKCLEKDSTRRYRTAQELAADLGRYLAGEPIQARPVGVVERATKWVRRNPVVAVLSAAVVVLLLAGTAISATFAFLAGQRADALGVKIHELTERDQQITRQQEDLLATNRELRTTLIKSWYGPLAQGEPRVPGGPIPLAPAEVDALQQIARHRAPGQGEQLVRIALEEPTRQARLWKRANYLLHAGVGLNEAERAVVERLLLAEMTRADRADTERGEFALALIRLGGLSDAASYATVSRFVRQLVHSRGFTTVRTPRDFLGPLLAALSTEQVRALVAALLPAMGGPDEPGHRAGQGEVLLLLAERLPHAEARPIYPAVALAVLRQCLESDWVPPLGNSPVLAETLPHLSEAEVAQAGAQLLAALGRWREGRTALDQRSFRTLLRAVLPRLPPAQRDALAALLAPRVATVRDGSGLMALASLLVEVAPTVSAAAARRQVEVFRDRIVVEGEVYQVGYRLLGLRALLERLDRQTRQELEPVFLPKLVALPLAPDDQVRREVGRCVALLVEGLPPDEAGRRVVALVEQVPLAGFRPVFAPPGFAAVLAPYLPPEAAARLAERLLTDPAASGLHGSARELLPVLERVAPAARPGLADLTVQQLAAAPSASATVPLLAVAVALLEGTPDAGRWDALARGVFRKWMALTSYQLTLGDLADLDRVLVRFPHPQRAWLVGQMVEALDPSRPTVSGRTLQFLRQVGHLGRTLEPAEVATAAGLLLAAHCAEPVGVPFPPEAAACWEALAPCLAPATNAHLAGRWLTHLERRPKSVVSAALEVLAPLVLHSGLDRRSLATRTAAFLGTALRATPLASSRYTLVNHLARHLAALDEATAQSSAAALLPVLRQGIVAGQPGSYDRRVLSFALLRLLPHLDPTRRAAETAALIDRLARTVKTAGDRAQFDEPVYLLPAVAGLLTQDQAAALARDICRSGLDGEVVAPLLRSLLGGVPRPDQPRVVAGLVGGLHAGTFYLGLVQAAPPFRVPDADLLDILAEPLCVGEPRRAVLEALEVRHRRSFADHWEAARHLRR